MWKIVGLQWAAGSLVCLLMLLISRDHALSAVWGVTSVVVPSTLFAARLSLGSRNAMSGVFVFLIGEFLKVIVSVAILFMAYRFDPNLVWWSVVLACAVTLKSYFLAFFLR